MTIQQVGGAIAAAMQLVHVTGCSRLVHQRTLDSGAILVVNCWAKDTEQRMGESAVIAMFASAQTVYVSAKLLPRLPVLQYALVIQDLGEILRRWCITLLWNLKHLLPRVFVPAILSRADAAVFNVGTGLSLGCVLVEAVLALFTRHAVLDVRTDLEFWSFHRSA